MKISGCVMTKNEEKNIKRCIDSFKNIVSEIIVVDTGSTDKTVEIAKACGAKVYYYEWNNDFASARNVALEHATGDWIIYMDADEYFYGATANNIPKLLNQIIDPNINSFLCKLLNIDISDYKEKSSAHVIRVFRNSPKIRFNYKIHEIVLNDGKLMMSAVISPEALLIYHTGYSSEIIEEKLKRNLDILIREQKENEGRPINYFYLGDCYFGLKDYKKAIDYMRKYIQTGHTNIGSNMKPYSIIIESMLKLGYKYEEIIKEIDKAIEKFPTHPLLYNHKAKVENINHKFESALKLFNKTLELHSTYNDVETNFVEGILFDNYYNIGCIYEYKNDYINAMEYYIKSLKEKKDYVPTFTKLIKIIKNENPEDIILLLKSIYDDKNENDVRFLVRELSTLKIGPVLTYYTNIWQKNFKKEDSSLIVSLLCRKNYEEAYKYFSRLYFEDWSYTYGLFSVISALLSKNEKNISEIQNCVKPSFRRFILAYSDNISTVFISEDSKDYLRIFQEFLLLGLKEEALTVFSMKDKFDINLSDALGNAYMDNNNYALAIENYLECLNHTDIYNEGYICSKIAIAYYKSYDYEHSLKYIEAALKHNFEDNAMFEYLHWIILQCKNSKLIDTCKKLLRKYNKAVSLQELYDEAEIKFNNKLYEAAEELYLELKDNKEDTAFASVACFRLGEIYNIKKRISDSERNHNMAFEIRPDFAALITEANHPSHNYKRTVINENYIYNCPLCGKEAVAHSCYNGITNIDFNQGFNPIRVWMYCKDCHHIFAKSYPSNIDKVLTDFSPEFYIKPNNEILPLMRETISNLKKYSKGNSYLEIGLGSGEMIEASKEQDFCSEGIEIRKLYAENISKRLNLPVYVQNFMDFEGSHTYDVIVMGDVLEHLLNPLKAIEKVYSLLNSDGLFWISTPNFDSDFSHEHGDRDPMWRVCEHLNYFSYKSLEKTLKNIGFSIVEYKNSKRYNGSMEIIARKL